MTAWLPRALLIVIVVGSVAVLLPGVRERLAVDRCLDSGGAYDYALRTCRSDVTTIPAQPVAMLHMPDRGSLLVALAIGVALARLFVTLDRRRRTRRRAA